MADWARTERDEQRSAANETGHLATDPSDGYNPDDFYDAWGHRRTT